MIYFKERPSYSPLIERVWMTNSDKSGPVTSIAAVHQEMIFSTIKGMTSISIRGPETHPTLAKYPSDGEWLAIRLSIGTYFPLIPSKYIIDGNDFDVQLASNKHFILNGFSWQILTYENAEVFIEKLYAVGILKQDPIIAAIAKNEVSEVSIRSSQRRFLSVTGISYQSFFQIERARLAASLLLSGHDIIHTTYELGFFD